MQMCSHPHRREHCWHLDTFPMAHPTEALERCCFCGETRMVHKDDVGMHRRDAEHGAYLVPFFVRRKGGG